MTWPSESQHTTRSKSCTAGSSAATSGSWPRWRGNTRRPKSRRKFYDLRTAAGLSQAALARKVGTTASVICRLEDADYDGHSLRMLRRIAEAPGRRVRIDFVPPPPKAA